MASTDEKNTFPHSLTPRAGGSRTDRIAIGMTPTRRPLFAAALSLSAVQGAPGIWRTVGTWLRRNRREVFDAGIFAIQGTHSLASGASLDVLYTDSESPYLHAVRYAHPDRDLPGRRWLVELSVRAEEGAPDIDVSVVLAAEDVSRVLLPDPRITRPVLVPLLIRHNHPSHETPGLGIKDLSPETVPEFRNRVVSVNRRAPLVVISPTPTGVYLVDPQRVLEQLAGIADVYVIPPGTSTRGLAEAVAQDVVPWHGGVRIIYPVRSGPYATPAPTRRLTPEDLDDWRIAGSNAAQEIMGIVAVRALRSQLARHISLEQVQEERIRRKVARNRRDDTTQVAALRSDIEALEEIITERESEIGMLRHDLDERDERLDELDDELRAHRHTVQALKHQLSRADSSPETAPASLLDGETRAALVRGLRGEASVADALCTIAAIYADRVLVLESAYKSAQESTKFRRPAQALDLLLKLAGPYWDLLQAGGGDAQARQVFGSHFAAQESDRVANNSAGRDYRTFTYRGDEVTMFRHLKIGVKPSASETIRIHFHWDAAERLIVIGYCGPHLDFS